MTVSIILEAVKRAFFAFKSGFAEGKSAGELFSAFTASLDSELGEYEIVYDYLLGPDSANIDGKTDGGYIPRRHDPVLMDISVGKEGVWCDVCRTFFVGEATDEQREKYEIIKASLYAGAEAMRVGALAHDVYDAVNGVYLSHGLSLVHHAGHRIGDAPLLQPQFLSGRDEPLAVGECYTVESGLYSEYGIRLENDFLLNKTGAIDLFESKMPLDIEEYILK